MKPSLMQDDLPRVLRTLERAMEYHREWAEMYLNERNTGEYIDHSAYMEAVGIAKHYIQQNEEKNSKEVE